MASVAEVSDCQGDDDVYKTSHNDRVRRMSGVPTPRPLSYSRRPLPSSAISGLSSNELSFSEVFRGISDITRVMCFKSVLVVSNVA